MTTLTLKAREEVILAVVRRTGRSREEVAEEVDRQLEEEVDGFAGETVEEAVGVLAFYCSTGLYDQVREAEAARLGIRVPTLDDLVEEGRARLAGNGAKGRDRHKAIARISGSLLRRGVDPCITYELCAAWNTTACRPPLPAEELQQVLDYVAGREQIRRSAA